MGRFCRCLSVCALLSGIVCPVVHAWGDEQGADATTDVSFYLAAYRGGSKFAMASWNLPEGEEGAARAVDLQGYLQGYSAGIGVRYTVAASGFGKLRAEVGYVRPFGWLRDGFGFAKGAATGENKDDFFVYIGAYWGMTHFMRAENLELYLGSRLNTKEVKSMVSPSRKVPSLYLISELRYKVGKSINVYAACQYAVSFMSSDRGSKLGFLGFAEPVIGVEFLL